MDKYIKHSDAINAYKKSLVEDKHRTVEGSLIHIQEHNHILHILDKLPAADVVEVVRCKDCRFWDNGRCEGIENGLIREFTASDDFCSYGERRLNNA